MDAYAESVKYFREENDGKLPSLKSLKKRKEELTKEIAERKKAYAPLREESRRLEIASDNNNSFPKHLRQPCKERRSFGVDVHHIVFSKCTIKCRKCGGADCSKSP